MSAKRDRDIEVEYGLSEFTAKLRRLADCLDNGENFEIQIRGQRIYVPARAVFSVEHERDDEGEEIEFQLRWKAEK